LSTFFKGQSNYSTFIKKSKIQLQNAKYYHIFAKSIKNISIGDIFGEAIWYHIVKFLKL